MGWVCGMCGGRGEVHVGVGGGDLDVAVPSIRQRNGFGGREPN